LRGRSGARGARDRSQQESSREIVETLVADLLSRWPLSRAAG